MITHQFIVSVPYCPKISNPVRAAGTVNIQGTVLQAGKDAATKGLFVVKHLCLFKKFVHQKEQHRSLPLGTFPENLERQLRELEKMQLN